MNDRELLEMAAKAAGIELEWSIDPTMSPRTKDTRIWNPIKYSGDALGLAVKLRLDIRINDYDTLCYGRNITEGEPAAETHSEFDDPYAATRLAITRAAAEIGKAMP
jgi:hypothetical protein